MISDEMKKRGITVDKMMMAVDSPLFFSWKDLKPLMQKTYITTKGDRTKKKGFFLTSMRSVGKSTVCAGLLIASYLCEGIRFLYMRRTEKTLWKTMRTFFEDAIDLFNDADLGFKISYFQCEGGEYSITVNFDDVDYTPKKYDKNGNLIELSDDDIADLKKKDLKKRAEDCGSCLHLKGYADARSGFNKKDMGYMLYDEFMAEQSTEYLGTKDNQAIEWQCLMSIFMSIAREKGNPFKSNVTMFFLGNNALNFNPILLGAGVNMFLSQSPDAHIISPKNAVWVYCNIEASEQFKEAQKNSLAYQWLQYDEVLRDYNFNNVAKTEDRHNGFVSKDIPKDCILYNTIMLGGRYFGIWYRKRDGLVYVSDKEYNVKRGAKIEALDLESYYNSNATLMVMNWRRSPTLSLIYERFICKRVMFNSKQTEFKFLQYLDFIPR